MKINTRESGDVRIIELQGKITIGAGDTQLRDAILQSVEEGKRNILLDMAGVTTLDSSGIGELVGSYTTVTNRSGKLKLLHLPSKISDLLQVTQLITIFEVYEDEKQAVESF
jgi:anti-anti-sigma factor